MLDKEQKQAQTQEIKLSHEAITIYCTYFTDDIVGAVEHRLNHGEIGQKMKNAETLRKVKQVPVMSNGNGNVTQVFCHFLNGAGICSSPKNENKRCHLKA